MVQLWVECACEGSAPAGQASQRVQRCKRDTGAAHRLAQATCPRWQQPPAGVICDSPATSARADLQQVQEGLKVQALCLLHPQQLQGTKAGSQTRQHERHWDRACNARAACRARHGCKLQGRHPRRPTRVPLHVLAPRTGLTACSAATASRPTYCCRPCREKARRSGLLSSARAQIQALNCCTPSGPLSARHICSVQ